MYSVLLKPFGVFFYPATPRSQLVTELSDVIPVTTRCNINEDFVSVKKQEL
jgi:hypothetical protein